MLEILYDSLLDALRLIPFLFVAFLIIELIEHKINNKKVITNLNKVGPFFGSLFGLFPQCGFSALGSNLYSSRIITLGTLISIYLSTSDEMLPILVSSKADISLILKILLIKFLVGIIYGFIIDLILRKKITLKNVNHEICDKEHCHCENSIVKSAIKHTFNTIFFIFIVSILLNIVLEYLGANFLSSLFLKNTVLGPLVSSIVGLIPNCASSVIITELYLNNAISFGSLISGLISGCGVGILVLFKVNKNYKENFIILLLVYFIGSITGIIIELINLL